MRGDEWSKQPRRSGPAALSVLVVPARAGLPLRATKKSLYWPLMVSSAKLPAMWFSRIWMRLCRYIAPANARPAPTKGPIADLAATLPCLRREEMWPARAQ